MLGRLLVAYCQLQQTAEAAGASERLRGALNQILRRRLAQKSQSLESLEDPIEAWAWAYLLLNGDKESSDLPAWLKASRMVLNAVDAATAEPGDRMWVNTMALLAFSRQLDAECVLSSEDPLAKEAVAETVGDILGLLRLDRTKLPTTTKGGVDPDLVQQHQLTLADAMRQVPAGDFRAWAISLVKLALVQAGAEEGDLAEAFREAMQSAAPGDLALGAITWAYAMYVAEWKLAASTASPPE
ncbi:unnamed protein product [Symbiodinium pilosum]|uniref:Uncharacterized protein n=1 Tax=Symbiodinium pilosum TaxID=2952 RepID=A0A812XDV6_SYMPI|nr:unnamed protein product [Symbiodinium pilosum]